jgi:hypothetical protein
MWESLQKFIPAAAVKYDFAATMKSINVCQSFRSLAPKIIHKDALINTYPVSYKDRTLTLAALSPVWANEINMKKHLLLQELNAKLGQNTVKNIRIQIGEHLPGRTAEDSPFPT